MGVAEASLAPQPQSPAASPGFMAPCSSLPLCPPRVSQRTCAMLAQCPPTLWPQREAGEGARRLGLLPCPCTRRVVGDAVHSQRAFLGCVTDGRTGGPSVWGMKLPFGPHCAFCSEDRISSWV